MVPDLKHIVGAGACWCGFLSPLRGGDGRLTHPEQADLFAGNRRHIARFDCGHVQAVLCPPIIGWGDWCKQCRDICRVIGGCDCKRFEDD